MVQFATDVKIDPSFDDFGGLPVAPEGKLTFQLVGRFVPHRPEGQFGNPPGKLILGGCQSGILGAEVQEGSPMNPGPRGPGFTSRAITVEGITRLS